MSRVERIAANIWKDFMLDIRRFSELGSLGVFVLAISVLTGYASQAGYAPSTSVVGVTTVIVFLAVYVALSSFIREADKGTLDGLRVSPVAPEELFIAKLVYSFMLLVVSSLAYSLFYTFFSQHGELLTPTALAATIAVCLYAASASSLTSAILVYSEARAVLLPVTILALLLPYLQFITPAYIEASMGVSIEASKVVWAGLAALCFTCLTVWLSRYALEAI